MGCGQLHRLHVPESSWRPIGPATCICLLVVVGLVAAGPATDPLSPGCASMVTHPDQPLLNGIRVNSLLRASAALLMFSSSSTRSGGTVGSWGGGLPHLLPSRRYWCSLVAEKFESFTTAAVAPVRMPAGSAGRFHGEERQSSTRGDPAPARVTPDRYPAGTGDGQQAPGHDSEFTASIGRRSDAADLRVGGIRSTSSRATKVLEVSLYGDAIADTTSGYFAGHQAEGREQVLST